jgi:preprotein translocase subunit SecY
MNELVRRIAITIGVLLVFRLGLSIPVMSMWASTGALPANLIPRVSVFSLSLVPYLSAAIFVRLLSIIWGRLGRLERSGEAGRRAIARYTLILTLLLAAFQAYGVASGLARVPQLVDSTDKLFVLSATTSMVGGVFLLIWLCEQITRHGIGNGLALVLSVNILISVPTDIAAAYEVVSHGMVSGQVALFHLVFWAAVVALMVLVESARRNIRVDFSERKVGDRMIAAGAAVLPIKLNSAGVLVPITVAPWFWSLPLALAAQHFGQQAPWLLTARDALAYGRPGHLIVGAIVIFVLALVYTSYVLDPEHAADSLGKHGGVIAGVAPGEATADYLDRAVSLTTLVGAVYLVAVALIPEAIIAYRNFVVPFNNILLPYKMSGGSALIVVCTILDLKKQVRALSLTNPGGERQ